MDDGLDVLVNTKTFTSRHVTSHDKVPPSKFPKMVGNKMSRTIPISTVHKKLQASRHHICLFYNN